MPRSHDCVLCLVRVSREGGERDALRWRYAFFVPGARVCESEALAERMLAYIERGAWTYKAVSTRKEGGGKRTHGSRASRFADVRDAF